MDAASAAHIADGDDRIATTGLSQQVAAVSLADPVIASPMSVAAGAQVPPPGLPALAKFASRARSWAALGLGLQHNTAVYNSCVFSAFSFLLQLATLSPELPDVEAAALRRLAPGPGNWIQPRDLHYLRECFGQSRSFVDPAVVSVAARLRVAAFEACAAGG